MNKWIRGILYVTAGCAGIGCAALIIGLTLGRYSQKELNFGALFGSGARDAVLRAGERIQEWADSRGHVRVRTEDKVEPFTNVDAGVIEEAEDELTGVLNVNAGQVDQLQIMLKHGYLEIVEGDADQIYVGLSEPADDIAVTCRENKIEIQDNRQGSTGREDVTIWMEVPEHKQFAHLEIQINAGVLDIECPLQADYMKLTADAGEISAEGLTADGFSASVGAGIIDINQGSVGSMNIDCGLGEIDLGEASVSADAQVKCGMGAVELELAEGADSVNYELSCGLGNIEIGDHSYSSLSREKKIHNGAAATFTLDCGMGEILIE